MIANCVVLKNGRIIDRNVWIEMQDEYNRVVVYSSTFCEPRDARDKLEFFDMDEISFIRPWGFRDPDLFTSFHHICNLALRDVKEGCFGNKKTSYKCKGLEEADR